MKVIPSTQTDPGMDTCGAVDPISVETLDIVLIDSASEMDGMILISANTNRATTTSTINRCVLSICVPSIAVMLDTQYKCKMLHNYLCGHLNLDNENL